MSSLPDSRYNEWTSTNFPTYLVLQEGTDPKALEAKFLPFIKQHLGSELEKYINATYDDFLKQGNEIRFDLTPLTSIHLHSHKEGELAANGDIKYVYIFSFIGFFILLLACINFMNLSTARSANRAKEVGLRKVVGATRPNLIAQFLSESAILSLLAMTIAVMFLQLLLPYFNDLSGKELHLAQINTSWFWSLMVVLTLVIGVVAGSYPAFFLSSFQPIKVLKGTLSRGAKGGNFRTAMVIFQFTITIFLIVGSLVVSKQLKFIQNKKLGFDKEQILILNDTYVLKDDVKVLKEEILQYPEVQSATISSFLPTPSNRNNNAHFLGRNPSPENMHVVYSFKVDHDYVQTFDMEILEGRDFDRAHISDSTAMIINEEAAKNVWYTRQPFKSRN